MRSDRMGPGSSARSALGHQGLHPPGVGPASRREGGAGAAQRPGLESSAPGRPLPRAAVEETAALEGAPAPWQPSSWRALVRAALRSALPMPVPRGGPGPWLPASPARALPGEAVGRRGQGAASPPGVARARAGRNLDVGRIWGSRERPQAFGGKWPAGRRSARLGEGGYLAMQGRTREVGGPPLQVPSPCVPLPPPSWV